MSDIDQAMRPAIGLSRRHLTTPVHPQRGAVRPYDPVFGGKRILFVGGLMELLQQMTVIGMQRPSEFVLVASDAPLAVRQVKTEQRHALRRPGSRPRHKVGFPRAHPAGRKRRAVEFLALPQVLQQTG
jgi:hypothetical protein